MSYVIFLSYVLYRILSTTFCQGLGSSHGDFEDFCSHLFITTVCLKILAPTAQMSRSKKNRTDSKDRFHQSNNRFQERDLFSDLTLVVEDQKLHVHKTLLMMHSPVFQKMLAGDFKEKSLSEIPLPGKKYSAMVNLLEQIYPGDGSSLLKDEMLEDLLKLADEYDIQQVFTNCKQSIQRHLLRKGVLHCLLAMVRKYDTEAYNMMIGEKDVFESTGTSWNDRSLFYLGLVDRFPALFELREKLVEQASLIPADEMEKSKYFLSVPATAMRDALLLQAKNGYKSPS